MITVPFKRLAIVNRGEAAMRAINAVRELNEELDEPITVIALYTEPERHALFVRQADEHHCLGPAMIEGEDGKSTSAYLDYERLERALVETEADVAWVGWGFVAEHPAFPELCEKLGITFVGPAADVMRKLGDKIEGKKLAEQAGVPVAPWSGGPVETAEEARKVGEELGFPLMIKAAAGGGGRGMRRVDKVEELDQAIERARSEAESAFGDPSVLMERLVGAARHVEVQLMADGQGGVWALGVRDCSYQRRHQKVVEESASPVLTTEQETELAESAKRLALEAGYKGAGTVEFLYEPDSGKFSFMEVNTRLQVEHPVTEAVTGADLVRLQLHVAAGGTLEGDPPPPRGHAIEVRLNAEDPGRGFSPSPGRISLLRLPAGPGIRVDSGVAEGDTVPAEFDSMMAKIIAHGDTREQAIARLRRAVADTMVNIEEGTTNQGFLLELLGRDELRKGEVDTGWLDRLQAAGEVQPIRHADAALVQAAIALSDAATADERARFYALARRGRPSADADVCRTVDLLHRGVSYRFQVCQIAPRRYLVEVDGTRIEATVEPLTEHESRLTYGGHVLPHRHRAAGRRPARRGQRRAAPRLARRGRPDPQPRPGRRGGDPGLRRRRGAGRRRRRGHRVDEDGELAHRDRPRARARGARLRQLARAGRQAAAPDRPARRGGGRRRGRAHPLRARRDGDERDRSWPTSSGSCSATTSRPTRSSACSRARPTTSPPSAGCSSSTPTSARSRARTPTASTTRTTSAARRSTCTRSCARSTPSPRACPTATSCTSAARSRTTASRGSSAPPRSRTPPTGCSSPSSARPPRARPCAPCSPATSSAATRWRATPARRSAPCSTAWRPRSRRASRRWPSSRARCAGARSTRPGSPPAARRPTRRWRSTCARSPRAGRPRRAHGRAGRVPAAAGAAARPRAPATPARWSRR